MNIKISNDKDKLKELKIKLLIEEIKNINISECKICEIKKLLIIKWLIKHFEILNYNFRVSTKKIKEGNLEESLKQQIKEKLMFENFNRNEYIEFKYNNYKIILGLDIYYNFYFKHKETNIEIELTEFNNFLNPNNISMTKDEINNMLVLTYNRLDNFVEQIKEQKEKIKSIKKKEIEFKEKINEFINENLFF